MMRINASETARFRPVQGLTDDGLVGSAPNTPTRRARSAPARSTRSSQGRSSSSEARPRARRVFSLSWARQPGRRSGAGCRSRHSTSSSIFSHGGNRQITSWTRQALKSPTRTTGSQEGRDAAGGHASGSGTPLNARRGLRSLGRGRLLRRRVRQGRAAAHPIKAVLGGLALT
jgi:hypothetical protein